MGDQMLLYISRRQTYDITGDFKLDAAKQTIWKIIPYLAKHARRSHDNDLI